MTMSSPDADLVRRLPSPLPALYRRSCAARDPREMHRLAVSAWDAAVKLLAAVAWAAAGKDTRVSAETEALLQRAPTRRGTSWLPFLLQCDSFLPDAERVLPSGRPLHQLGNGRLTELYLALQAELHDPSSASNNETNFSAVGLAELLAALGDYGARAVGEADGAALGRMSVLLLAGLLELFAAVDVLAGRQFVTVSRLKYQPPNNWRIERLALSGETPEMPEPLIVADPDVMKLPKPNCLYLEGTFTDAEESEPPFRTLTPLLICHPGEAEILFFHGKTGAATEYWSFLRDRVVTALDEKTPEAERAATVIVARPTPSGARAPIHLPPDDAQDAVDRFFADEDILPSARDELEPVPPPRIDENVQFTVYRPKAVRPNLWYPLLAFAHLAERRADASPDEPDPVQEVRRQAAQVLGSRKLQFQSVTQETTRALPETGELTFVPSIPGVEFNPPRAAFRWLETVHRTDFRLRAASHLEGQTARGKLTVFLGSLIVAEVNLSLNVDSRQLSLPEAPPTESVHAGPYRRIFVSYSHQDGKIVDQFDVLVRALGDEYLRDVTHLRSGQVWTDRLQKMIEEADVFQLFWSSNAMRSAFVRREWEHALSLRRPHFIRPTYWEDPLPRDPRNNLPPQELLELQFQRIGFAEFVKPVVTEAEGDGAEKASETHSAPPPPTKESPARFATVAVGAPARRRRSGYFLALLVLLLVVAIVLFLVYKVRGESLPARGHNVTSFNRTALKTRTTKRFPTVTRAWVGSVITRPSRLRCLGTV
jgi:hypothetical protein